jgi:hypothetical protein
MQALSQLSYGPTSLPEPAKRGEREAGEGT